MIAHKTSSKVSTRNPRWSTVSVEGEKRGLSQDFITFDLYSKDIPSGAVLSVSLVEERPPSTGKKKSAASSSGEARMVGWGNVRLADWRDELRQGLVTIQLSPPPQGDCPPAPSGHPAPPFLNPFAAPPEQTPKTGQFPLQRSKGGVEVAFDWSSR